MKRIKILYLPFILIVLGCNHEAKEELSLNLSEVNSVDNWLLENSSDIEIIPLEYNGFESLVLSIRDVVTIGSDFFVIDSDISNMKSIKKFDGTGKFRGSIESIEFEYRNYNIESVSEFTGDKLLVLDKFNNCFVLKNDLSVEKMYELPFKAAEVAYFENNIYFHSNKRGINNQADSLLFDFIVYNVNFELVSKFDAFSIPEYSQNVRLAMDHTFTTSDKLLFASLTGDTIYNVSPIGKANYLKVSFKNPTFRFSDYPDVALNSLLPILQSDFSWGLSNLISFNDYVLFNYYDKDKIKCAAINVANNNVAIVDPIKLKISSDVLPWPRVVSGGFLLGWYSEESLSWFANINSMDKNSVIFRSKEFVDKNSNPVLIRYKLK
ncbi:hypothetical protein [Algoriphagus aquimarinus]|uniref:hypothetical protein n=1 Tax=Algoriphagus aquimarinus TaxID=237018 RepID=UPI0030DDBCE4|tara:strand:+ start:56126 stop:57265 length:1140 start_codon:yes stop_codon:yes gene_type:complete